MLPPLHRCQASCHPRFDERAAVRLHCHVQLPTLLLAEAVIKRQRVGCWHLLLRAVRQQAALGLAIELQRRPAALPESIVAAGGRKVADNIVEKLSVTWAQMMGADDELPYGLRLLQRGSWPC